MIYRVTLTNMPPKGKSNTRKGKDKNKIIDDTSIARLLSSIYRGEEGEEEREEGYDNINLSDTNSILETLVPALIFLCEKVN